MHPDWVRRFQSRGVRVGGGATCVAEAEKLEALGVDFIIAQGAEAGGHRGTHLRDPYDSMTGTFALVRLIARRVKTPVVAAGGIMDGAGIAAALALGAQAVQMGTAFIPCPESGAPRVHKEAVLAAREDETLITEKFSGKPARGLANRFMREMHASAAPQLAFPAQSALTGKLRAASAKRTIPTSSRCGRDRRWHCRARCRRASWSPRWKRKRSSAWTGSPGCVAEHEDFVLELSWMIR